MNLLYFGQMGHGAFSMLCGHIGMAGLAMLNRLLEVLDPFIHMRIFPGCSGMLERFLCMLHDGIGMTGLATAPHLHYEIRVNGKPVDPLTYVLPNAEP